MQLRPEKDSPGEGQSPFGTQLETPQFGRKRVGKQVAIQLVAGCAQNIASFE